MKKLFAFTLVFFTANFISKAQLSEIQPPPHIQTVIFKGATPQAQIPIIKLGESITLEFDDINANERDYFYTIEHFNFDWTPTDLVKSEYLDGFDDILVNFWENSYNTFQSFTHYRLTVPNRDTRAITKSGNYLLSIFDSYGNVVFTRKFMVYENNANVGVEIKRSRNMNLIRQQQVVWFSIGSQGTLFINPNQNVKVLAMQNHNINTAITNLKPQYTMGNDLIYRYDQEAAFWGGNEYLNFDNSDVRGATSAIRAIDLQDLYINYLYTNAARKDRPYTYFPDINGRFQVRNIRGQKASIDAEYVWIHFALNYFEDIGDRDIHIYGAFNNFAIDESTKMEYDPKSDNYKLRRLFKQGFYNYKYVIVDKNGDVDEGAIDGNFDVTENEYTVVAYYREPGGRFDRIIGVGHANSENITN